MLSSANLMNYISGLARYCTVYKHSSENLSAVLYFSIEYLFSKKSLISGMHSSPVLGFDPLSTLVFYCQHPTIEMKRMKTRKLIQVCKVNFTDFFKDIITISTEKLGTLIHHEVCKGHDERWYMCSQFDIINRSSSCLHMYNQTKTSVGMIGLQGSDSLVL